MPHQCTSCGRSFADGSKEMLSGCPDCGGNKFQFMPAGAVDASAGGGSGPETATAQKKKPPARKGTSSATKKQSTSAKKQSTTAKKQSSAPEKQPPASKKPGDASPANADAPPTASDAPETEGGHTEPDDRNAVNRAAATVRDWVRSRDEGDGRSRDESDGHSRDDADEVADPSTGRADRPGTNVPEDSAQASARSDVVSESELPDATSESELADEQSRPVQSTASRSEQSPSSRSRQSPTDAGPGEGNVADAPSDDDPGLKELRDELNSQFESIRIVEPGQYELNLMELYEREEYIISLKEDGKYVIEVPDAWDEVDR